MIETCKPPLGIKPEKIWLQDRIMELSRAIGEYAHYNYEINMAWVDELKRHADRIKTKEDI